MQQPQFGLVTKERVLGMLKATGSTDPDVLLAAKEEFAYGYRILKWFGIWGLVTGGLATLLIVTAIIGIPVLIFGWWALRRSKRNVRLIESTFAEYVQSVSGKAPAAVRPAAVGVVAMCLLALGGQIALAQDQVPTPFQGDWVPSTASCTSSLRFRAEATRMTLINGRDSAIYGDLAIARGFMGPEYTGIIEVMMPELNSGEPPFTAYFNADEKKGVTKLDIYTEMPGRPVNAQVAAIQGRAKRLSQRFPLHMIALKRCLIRSVPGPRAAAPPVRPPSICGNNPRCAEVTPFAATITDFRTSSAGSARVVSLTVRFQNKTAQPLILAYLQGSGLILDDQGNRYGVYGQNGVRGIGQITGNTFDPKFVLQPGEASDARFELGWRPSQGNQIYGTIYDLNLSVREIEPLAGDQYRLGKEHALEVRGLTSATAAPVAGAPAGGGATPVADRGAPTAVPAEAVDACAGKARCYSAGPFTAEVGQVSQSKAGYWQLIRLHVKLRNLTSEPLILAFRSGSGTGSDDQANRWTAHDLKGAVRGIGLVGRGVADPQFVLSPGAARQITVEYSMYMSRGVILGTVWNTDFTLEQLEMLPSRQVRSLREYPVSFAGLTASPSSGTPAAVQNTNLADEVKKLFPKKK